MENRLQFTFDHKKKIIYEKYQGKISFVEFIRHQEYKIKNPEYNDTYSLFKDIRGARFIMTKEEKEIIYNLFEGFGSKINMNRKCAIITNDVSEVVYSELFKFRMKEISPMMFKVFSDEEAAYDWIL